MAAFVCLFAVARPQTHLGRASSQLRELHHGLSGGGGIQDEREAWRDGREEAAGHEAGRGDELWPA